MSLIKTAAVALALDLTAFGVCPAIAQEQDNLSHPDQIPDPHTYQGSVELQRRSDEQDEQTRQQLQNQQKQQEQDWEWAQQQTQAQLNSRSPAPHRPSAATGHHAAGTTPASPGRSVGVTHMAASDPAGLALQRGNYAVAFRLTHEAAARDHYLNAMKNLGNLYEDGLGTRKNLQLAAQWYRACADLGAVVCQFELMRLYWVGRGVQRDPVEAYKWALIAGRPGGFKQALFAQNSEFQRENTGAMRQNAALVRNSLSYDQLSEAMHRYQLWTPAESVRLPETGAPPRRR